MSLEQFKTLVKESIREEIRENFSPSRYPYTYAADYLRGHSELIPEQIFDEVVPLDYHGIARSQSSQIRTKWAAELGIDDKLAAEILANAYLIENRVSNVPFDIEV